MTNPKTYYEIKEWDVIELRKAAYDIASWGVIAKNVANQEFWEDYLLSLADRIQHNLEEGDG